MGKKKNKKNKKSEVVPVSVDSEAIFDVVGLRNALNRYFGGHDTVWGIEDTISMLKNKPDIQCIKISGFPMDFQVRLPGCDGEYLAFNYSGTKNKLDVEGYDPECSYGVAHKMPELPATHYFLTNNGHFTLWRGHSGIKGHTYTEVELPKGPYVHGYLMFEGSNNKHIDTASIVNLGDSKTMKITVAGITYTL
ncbi:MAG: hypothetical protein KAI53_03540 [Candidatus Aenigmarchaeota archaeon]|nr:hypothetical protein [Candidatus Aenigmarchaeota archaeon]